MKVAWKTLQEVARKFGISLQNATPFKLLSDLLKATESIDSVLEEQKISVAGSYVST